MASGTPDYSTPYIFNYARATLGETINGVINSLNTTHRGRNVETVTTGDNTNATLNGGDVVNKVATIVNTDDDEHAIVSLQGSSHSTFLHSNTSSTFTVTNTTDAATNIYHNTSANEYQLENKEGGERTYEITYEGA